MLEKSAGNCCRGVGIGPSFCGWDGGLDEQLPRWRNIDLGLLLAWMCEPDFVCLGEATIE